MSNKHEGSSFHDYYKEHTVSSTTFEHISTTCINSAINKSSEVLKQRFDTCVKAIDDAMTAMDSDISDDELDKIAKEVSKRKDERLRLEGAVEGINFLIQLIQREAEFSRQETLKASQLEAPETAAP